MVRILFTLAVLFFVGRQFWRDLRPEISGDLWKRPPHFAWLTVSGFLYLIGLGFSLFFWYRLLIRLGQKPRLLAAIRAYYLGHMGKYLPGKAWALMLRATLIRSAGVRIGVAVLSSFYEVLTTMAGAVVLAPVLFLCLFPESPAGFDWASLRRLVSFRELQPAGLERTALVVMSLVLLAIVGGPILPPVFNRIVHRISLPFQDRSGREAPRVTWRALGEGIVITTLAWLVMGASLWAVLRALRGDALAFTLPVWGRLSAYVSLAYVAGFVIVLVPSGLGIREYFLKVFLTYELIVAEGTGAVDAGAQAVLAVLLLRMVWTAAEVVVNAVVYWLPGPRAPSLGDVVETAGVAEP